MRILPSRARGRLLLLLVVLVVLFLAVTARLFVWPPTDQPSRADAVVALGGDPGQLRAKQAIALVRAGYAPVAVVSLGDVPEAPCPVATAGVKVECFRADPLDTRGEAEYVAALAAREHWSKVILVPERSQATRARLIFERCTHAQLVVVPVTDHGWHLLYDVAYEWGSLAKALVIQRSC
jgi:uncharacterized SAM-binding protein YcdF (DUF218 family)